MPGFRMSSIAVLLGLCASASTADTVRTAPEYQPTHTRHFVTANILPKQTLRFNIGTQQVDPRIDVPGTGNQMYFHGLSFSLSDRLEIGADFMRYNDPPPRPIAGASPNIIVKGGALWGKGTVYDRGPLQVAVRASAELLTFESDFFNSPSWNYRFYSAFDLPMTWTVSPRLQFHLKPGIALFPETKTGAAFFGPIANIGGAVTFKPTARTLLYATVTQPLTGHNVIKSDGSYGRRTVFSAGGRYALAPNTAVDFYVTNGFGPTPATSVLSWFPDGDFLIVGANLIYTFGPGSPDKLPYGRVVQNAPRGIWTAHSGDGFTLTGPRTLRRYRVRADLIGATHGGFGGMATFAPDHFFEIGASYERLSDDGSGALGQLLGPDDRWTGHLKAQLSDQVDGAPLTSAVVLTVGRDLTRKGAFFAAMPVMREFGSTAAIKVVPKAAFFGNREEYGLGFGASYRLFEGVDLVGEVTARDHGDAIWAVGAKTRMRRLPIEVGLQATNAIGNWGLNSMFAQKDPKIALSVSVVQDYRP